MADREHHPRAPTDPTSVVDSRTPPETLHLAEQAGIAKAHLSWPDLIIKSFIAGIFISLGAGFDLVLTGGAPGLRSSNPALATLIGAFSFPTGFVCIMLTNMELCTSNMFVMAYSTLQRRTSLYDLARNWIISYIFNIAGCLFYAGVLFWWSDLLNTDAQTAYAVTQAEGRVNVNWGYNVTRGIMCNWLVGPRQYVQDLRHLGRGDGFRGYGVSALHCELLSGSGWDVLWDEFRGWEVHLGVLHSGHDWEHHRRRRIWRACYVDSIWEA
jgi:hypothetical protein